MREVLEDEGFHLPTPQASESLQAALDMLEWCQEDSNQEKASLFSQTLVGHLQKCLPSELDQEKMWRQFHLFRSSKDHFILWDQFLKTSIRKGGPIFFQYVTVNMFKKLIKQQFPVPAQEGTTVETVTLTYEEKNIIRYVSGYIPKNLLKKLKKSSHPRKESLRMCVLDMIEEAGVEADSEDGVEADGEDGVEADSENPSLSASTPSSLSSLTPSSLSASTPTSSNMSRTDSEEDHSHDWIRMVNRGGLTNVGDGVYSFVSAVKLVVKALLKTKTSVQVKTDLVTAISESVSVQQC